MMSEYAPKHLADAEATQDERAEDYAPKHLRSGPETTETRVDSKGVLRHYLAGTDMLHREDGPAIEGRTHISFFQFGVPHREGDEPAMMTPNGTRLYYVEGKLHRDGKNPAVIYANGNVEYWEHGVQIEHP